MQAKAFGGHVRRSKGIEELDKGRPKQEGRRVEGIEGGETFPPPPPPSV